VAREEKITTIPVEKVLGDLNFIEVLNVTLDRDNIPDTNVNVSLTNYYQEYNELDSSGEFIDFLSLKVGFSDSMGVEIITTKTQMLLYSINDEKLYQISEINIEDLVLPEIKENYTDIEPVAVCVHESYEIDTLYFFIEIKAKKLKPTPADPPAKIAPIQYQNFLIPFVYKCEKNLVQSKYEIVCTLDLKPLTYLPQLKLYDENGQVLDIECEAPRLYQFVGNGDAGFRYIYRICSVGDLELKYKKKIFNEIFVYSFYKFAKFNEFTIGYYVKDEKTKPVQLQTISLVDWRKRLFILDQNGIFWFDNIDVHYQYFNGKLTLTPPLITFDSEHVLDIKCITEGNVLINCVIKYQSLVNFVDGALKIALKSVGFYLHKQSSNTLGKMVANRERNLGLVTAFTDFVVFKNYIVLVIPEIGTTQKTLKIID
jgi:hypothetical protein